MQPARSGHSEATGQRKNSLAANYPRLPDRRCKFLTRVRRPPGPGRKVKWPHRFPRLSPDRRMADVIDYEFGISAIDSGYQRRAPRCDPPDSRERPRRDCRHRREQLGASRACGIAREGHRARASRLRGVDAYPSRPRRRRRIVAEPAAQRDADCASARRASHYRPRETDCEHRGRVRGGRNGADLRHASCRCRASA